MPDLYLGIDVGTSGIRASCINEEGNEVAGVRTHLPAPDDVDGRIQQDPEIWWQATVEVIGQICKQIDTDRLRAISIDGTSGTVLLTDEQGQPLTPALMYAHRSPAEYVERIRAHVDESSAAISPNGGLAHLLELLEMAPQARRLCHQADWLAGRICGRYDISDENNCLKTGYDPVARSWLEALQKIGLERTLLPNVVPAGTRYTRIDTAFAERFRINTSCEMVAGTTDSIAAFLATGANDPGDAVTSLGTTLAIKMVSDHPVNDNELGIYSHRLKDLWLIGGASNTGGRVLLDHFSIDEIRSMSDRLEPERTLGLDYYPLSSAGERFPRCDDELQPRLTPRPENTVDFFQAILEGIASIECEAYRLLTARSGIDVHRILTCGGGSSNEGWTRIRQQMLAAEFDDIIVVSAEHSEASYGSAILARDAITGTRER